MNDETPLPINPFFFELPSDRWSFTDREDLLPMLAAFYGESGRRLLVHGRRRMGKTSLLQNAALKSGCILLYVDVSVAANLNEVAKKLLQAAPPDDEKLLARALDLARKYLKEVSISAGKLTLSGEIRLDRGEETLEHVLNYLDARAALSDRPWSICLDEFQQIRAFGGERIDWRIRGIIQQHRHLNYIFSGSEQRLIRWMTEPGAPFFKQLQQIEVGPIESVHLARWLERRARTGGLPEFPYGEEIVALAGPCTGDVIRLAKSAFELAARGKPGPKLVATAFDAIALAELGAEFNARWAECTVSQRSVLRAIAAGKGPTAADTLRAYGIKSASTAQGAVEALIDRFLLVRAPGSLLFDSPFFRRWVAFNGA